MKNYTLYADGAPICRSHDPNAIWQAMREGRTDPALYNSRYSLDIDDQPADILEWQEAYLANSALG